MILVLIMHLFQVYFVPLQCHRAMSLESFFKQMYAGPIKVAWLGSGCSVATEPTAELSHFFNIPQVEHDFARFDAINRTQSCL